MKFFNKLNKALATTALSIGIATSSFCGINLIKSQDYTVYALPYGGQIISKITDNDFHNFSGTAYGTPSNWTTASGGDTENSEKFVSGIMNLTSDNTWRSNYDENFKLEDGQNPDDGYTDDKYYLYINNFSTSPVKYGYASDTFELTKNSYYSITVQLKTIVSQGQSAKASMYITGLDETIKMENVYTDGAWQNYTFYIATNSVLTSSGLNLELWLGSKTSGSYGAMFVNLVEVKQYDESTFNSLQDKDSSTSIYTNLNEKQFYAPFANNGFEGQSMTGWELDQNSSNDGDNQYIGSVIIGNGFDNRVTTNWNAPNPYTINSFNNQYALLISNKTNLISGVVSPRISIKQHGLYKLSVWAYSKAGSGNGATIMVKEVGAVGTNLAYVTKAVSNNTTGSQVTSDWVEYSVYIQGNAFNDTEVTLGLYLGTPAFGDGEASPTSGYVYFDEIRMQEIDYNEYSQGITDSNATELNITQNSNYGLVSNNRFDKAKNEDSNISYPLAPQNFTKAVKDVSGQDVTNVTTYSGIVNTNTAHWDKNKSKYGEAKNPGAYPSNNSDNNILMIGTTNPTISQTYTSDSFTLSSSSYYKISVWVQTQIYPQYDGASITLLNNSRYIYKKENINTHDTWQQITFFLKTGASEITATFELALNETNGCVFFDNLYVESYTSEELFNSAIKDGDKVIDLTYEGFDTQNSFTGYFDESVTNQSAKDNLLSGIKELNGNNVLYIDSRGSDVYYTLSSSNTYSLTQGSYYKLSLDVYTLNLSQEEENKKYDDDGNVIPYGVTIALKNSTSTFNKSITGINTAEITQGNGFTTYNFYIYANQSIDVYLYLSLGNTDAFTNGIVYFDNIKFDTTLTEDQFNEAKNDFAHEKTNLIIEDTIIDEEEETDTEDEEEKTPYEFPWILVSSLITGLAIIIAIVGYFVRKINFKRVPKVKTSYDRRKTLDVELDKKERIQMRQSMIEELKLQLHTIDDEIAAIKEMFAAKEAQIILNEKAKREQIENDKKELATRKEAATQEYKELLASSITDKEKQAAERNFARYINKLNKQETELQKLLDKKETASALLKLRREQQLQRYIDAQTQIAKEIERIEQEIEQIAKEDEQVWEEYRQAKQEAKVRKQAYKQEKKLDKSSKKSNDKNVDEKKDNLDDSEK